MRLHRSHRVPLSPRLFAATIALTGAAMIVTSVPAIAAEPEDITSKTSGTAKHPDSDGDGIPERPDSVSAAATARALDERVEDLSKRTEMSQTFANPDGTLTDEVSGGEQRVMDENGAWSDIDLDLVKQADGSYAPNAAASDVIIGGGGSTLAASIELADGQSLDVNWPEKLPQPEIAGGVATYKLSEASDLLVSTTKAGVAVRIRLNAKPATDDPALTLKLRTEGLDVDTTDQGSLSLTDDDEKTVATTAAMTAWDAAVDEAGDPSNVTSVEPTLEEISVKGDVTKSELTLTPEDGFLTDPDTKYPVTVDPDISAVTKARDTMVREGITATQGTDPRLWVGRLAESSSANHWMSYMQWKNDQLTGRTILAATAKFYQYGAGGCGKQINFHPLTSSFAESTTVWTNKPTIGTTNWVSTTAGPCTTANGWLSVNVKAMVQAWANNAASNFGIRLAPPTDYVSSTAYTRRFCSANENSANAPCNVAAHNPILSVTYNSPPAKPNPVTVDSSTSNAGTVYVRSNKPKISAKLTDPEATSVRSHIKVMQGSTVKADVYSPYVASGGTATKQLDTALADGTYEVRVWANDGQYESSTYASLPLVVDTVAPPTPTVTCTGAVISGQWYDARPAESTACTVTSAGSKTITWTKNKQPQTALVPNGSGAATTPSMAIAKDGVLGLTFTATDAAGNTSAVRKFGFGTGAGATITPVQGERTSSTTLVTAEGPGGANSAHIEYRAPGDDTAAWIDATHVNGANASGHVNVSTSDFGTSLTPSMIWDMGAEDDIDAPAVRDMRVCFVFDGVDKCTPSRQVTLVPAAFGSSFPTQSFGPGTLALSTGEYSLDQTDVSVPGFGGDLTLGRSHRSFAGATSAAASVFGPGWVADLTGPDPGEASVEVVDHTTNEAAITLVAPDGSSSTYVNADDQASAQRPGYYVGDAETGTENNVLELYSDSGSKYLTLTEEDGTETTWKHFGSGTWAIEKVTEPFETGTTRYDHNADGLVTGIYAAAPDGVSCNPANQTAGCRALLLNYNDDDLLTQVDLKVWDPKPATDGTPSANAGMRTITVAEYAYTGGRLTEVRDPRTGSMKTEYEYDTIGSKTVLTKITEPGLTPWRFNYATSGDNKGKLTSVKRAQTSGSSDATWTVDYSTPLSGTGLPDLGDIAKWGQTNAPVAAATVYGPDAPASPAPSDGTISYWDTEGRTTNTATYGAGDWQLDATTYDAKGNVVWSLDEGNRRRALASSSDAAESAETANTLATITTYNADGTRVESTTGPTRTVMLKNGDMIAGREYVETVYDDEAAAEDVPATGRPKPDSDAPSLNLPVEERSGVIDATGTTYDISRTRYGYDPIQTGDADGWTTGQATQTSTELGSGWSTTQARYNTDGLLIATTTPQGVAATGNERDVRTRVTTYYTAGPSATVANCGNKPQWAGQVCRTGPAAQPTTGDPIPVESTTGYDYVLNATRVEETSGSMTRVDVTGHDDAGRTTSNATTMTGSPAGDQSIPAITRTYSTSTGLPTSVTDGTRTQTTGYDAWGRVTSQTDGAGNTATTTYDSAGRVKTKTNEKGTYTYTYDGTDANGDVEKRGLVTKLDVDLASGPDEMTAAYDADGNPVTTVYPGGVKATRSYDPAGTETALAWTDANDIDLAAFSQTVDAEGRVRVATSPGSSQTYTYDDRGRLTNVQDTGEASCVTRAYGFSLDSNRTSLATSGPAADGTCSTSGASTKSSTFDVADRITNPGYTYDPLGRTRTVPASDTDQPAGGSLSVNYHANDMVAKVTQSVPSGSSTTTRSKTYRLDIAGRIATIADATDGTELRQVNNHYDDSGDAPSWVATTTRTDAAAAWTATWTRNIVGIDGNLAITAGSDGTATLHIANEHGDIVATVDLANPTSGLTGFAETNEYGVARDRVSDVGQYRWLGTKQRSVDAVGAMVLMGARLFNPTTGAFLSRDPVDGGNDNTYTYPADPVNQSDPTGRWCVARVGTTCTRYVKDRYGRSVRVTHRVRSKHNISWGSLKYMIGHAVQLRTEGTAVVYNYVAEQGSCRLGFCKKTGVRVNVKIVVDFRTMSNGKTKGLVTAHCLMPGKIPTCPNWVNSRGIGF